jgi:EAL domain-containing protein (putative c-di-GMP-specific phosphodiesterase class I)
VETDEVLDRLTEFGCDEAQGYAVCHPLTSEDIVHWLATRARAPEPAVSGAALDVS